MQGNGWAALRRGARPFVHCRNDGGTALLQDDWVATGWTARLGKQPGENGPVCSKVRLLLQANWQVSSATDELIRIQLGSLEP